MDRMASDANDNLPDNEALAEPIAASYLADERVEHLGATFLPSRQKTVALLERLRELLFPGFFGDEPISRDNVQQAVAERMGVIREMLERQIDAALRYAENLEADGQGDRCAECTAKARRIAADFLARVPELRRMLSLDVQAAFDGDPACRHTDEAIFCYPGIFAVMVHRIAHELFKMDVPLIPRMMNEHAHSLTGIDIHPGATIGESFFIDHGTGVVVGETSIIGRNVKVYQSVTIGAPAAALSQSARGQKRHPTIEDDVVIYANATILGGDTVIGKGSIIGGGVFLTASVPPGHFVYNTPQELKYRSAEKIKALAAASAKR
jgi:serine O-acetyltransferase